MMRLFVLASTLALVTSSALAAHHRVPKKAPPQKVLVSADAEQLDAAARTYLGPYACELGQTLEARANPQAPGYVDVMFKNKTYTMKPMASPTGALRLEDVKGQTLLIQIANKSMLMDVKGGSRLVDNCVNEKQRMVEKN